ncbi:MAG TPA: O-antigen ligase family protein [Gaiellaceae bacterium]
MARELRSPLAPAFALVAASVFFARDPGDASLPWLGLAALALVVILFATQSPPSGAIVLLPLAGLAAWCAITIDWSIEPDRSWSYSNRTLVYVAFALVGALLGAEPRKLLYGFAGLLGVVEVWALAGKVLPWLHEGYGGISRLSAPVGYWNGLALLGDIALPIGLCLATRRRIPATLFVFGWIVVIGMTYSRGGVVVAVVVVGLWMVLSKAWIEAASTLLAAGLPAAGSLAVAFSLSGLTSDGQTHPTRVRDGLVFGAVLLIDGAIAVALTRYSVPAGELTNRIAKGLLAVAAVGVLAVGVLHGSAWWNDFSNPSGAEVGNGAGRLVSAGSNLRSAWWREAWKGFDAAPLKGTGAGSFLFTNERYRKSNTDQAIEPHNLPLQFLSETGIVGLVLFLGAVAWLIKVGRRRPGPQLALALALPAYFLHGLLDIDWDFISVSAPVFLIAGALAVRTSTRRRPRGFTVLTAGGLLILPALSLGAVWLGGHWQGQADAAVGVDDAHAVLLTRRVRAVNPVTVEPLFTAAFAELDQAQSIRAKHAKGWQADYVKTNSLAHGYFVKATEVQPYSSDAWFRLGFFDLEPEKGIRPCPQEALHAFNRFTVLNGQSADNIYYAMALAIVNKGKAKC